MVAQENRLPTTLMAAMRHFTPDVADAYVSSIKWPDGACCPKCGSVNAAPMCWCESSPPFRFASSAHEKTGDCAPVLLAVSPA